MWPRNTRKSDVGRFGVVTLAVVASFSLVFAAAPAAAQTGNEHFSVRMSDQDIHGYQWEEGVSVTLDIDDPANGPGSDYTDTQLALPPEWDPTMGYVHFQPFIDEFLIEPGFVVTLTQGTTTKTHRVTSLTVTDVNVSTDVVSGTGDEGAQIHVAVWDEFGTWREPIVVGVAWSADFSVAGPGGDPVDITRGTAGGASEEDLDGDTTEWLWRVPDPAFSVETPGSLWSFNDGWIPGRTVTVTVDDNAVPGDGVLYQQTTEVQSWGPSPWDAGWNINNLPFDIAPGHYVTADDGVEVSKTLHVVDLAVTSVDETLDIIAGTAPPGSLVEVYACEEFLCGNRSVVAEGTGVWSADFSVPGTGDHEQDVIAIQSGFGGAAQIYDDDGDSSHRGWQLNDPYFGVDVANEEMWAANWPAGETLTFQVFADDTMADLLWTDTMTVYGTPWQNTEAGYRFWSEFDVQGGQYFTVADGVTTKSLVISTVSITDVNPGTDVYTGTVDPTVPADVTTDVCAWARMLGDPNQGVELCDMPDSLGGWTIDFSGVGDIIPGDHAGVYQRDADGDETSHSWGVPPWIYVELAEQDAGVDLYPDRIHLDQWTGPVDIYLNGALAMSGVITNGDNVQVDLDVEIGQTIRVVDGVDDKSLDIKLLTVDDVTAWDALVQPSTAFGRADVPDNTRHVQVTASADYGWWTERWVPVLSGEYQADFANPGNGWRESEIGYFGEGGADDIYLGGEVRANLWDFDNDQVQAIWHTCNPRIIIVRGNDRIEAVCFPVGSELVIELDDPAFAGIEWTSGDPVVVTRDPDKPWETLVVFELGDYTAPDEAAVTATATEEGIPVVVVTTEIVGFTVDAMDDLLDTVTGTAPAGSEVLVETSGNWRYPIADEFNTWVADFSVPGDQPGEENPVDLVPGTDGSATLIDAGGSATTVLWHISNTRFYVGAGSDSVWGNEWLPDASVDVSINGVPHSSWSTDGSGYFGNDWNAFGTDLVSGDLVEVTDGETTKLHRVTPLAITSIDAGTDEIFGTATPDAMINVGIYGAGVSRTVVVDPFGDWSVDFTGEHDLVAGDDGDATDCDPDGDCSYASWRIPAPWFQVFPGVEDMSGYEFAPGALLTITVDDGSGSGPVALPGGPYATDESGNFDINFDQSEFDLLAGDIVVVSDGDTTKDHAVSELVIVEADPDTDTITGVAAPGSTVHVWEHWEGNSLSVVACGVVLFPCGGDELGTWHAEFDGVVDLVAGIDGNSNQCDDDSDCTHAWWRIPAPQFQVDPSSENLWGNDFEPDAELTITVDAVAVPGGPYSTDEWGNFGTWFDSGDLDLMAGDVVVVSDGTSTKTHTVTNLTVTAIDSDTNHVFGTAAAGSEVWVDVHGHWEAGRTVIVDEFGDWSTDFDDPGAEGGTHDLEPGVGGYVSQCDGDNDCTQANWRVPTPQFRVEPLSENLWGDDFTPGALLTITVDAVTVPGSPYYADEWGNFGIWFEHGELDLVAGDLVSVSDGDTTKTHSVTDLAITVVDPDTNQVSGTAAAGSEVWVDIHGHWEAARTVIVDEFGDWSTDFDDPGDEGGTHDLEPGTEGYASQCDGDNDCTHLEWRVPAPQFQVIPWHDNILGHEFVPDAELTVTVNSVPVPGGPYYADQWGNVNVDFDQGELNLMAGDLVVVSDGETSKSHTVTDLVITGANPGSDTVTGLAAPRSSIEVWAWEYDAGFEVFACDDTPDFPCNGEPPGTWQSDLSASVDLVVGSNGNANQCDDDGDCTSVWWQIDESANPQFRVDQTADRLSGDEWASGRQVTIIVDDGNDPPLELFVTTEFGTGEGQFDVYIGDMFDLRPGHRVTLLDGSSTKSLLISSLEVTDVDVAADMLSGIASPGAEIIVGVTEYVEGAIWEHLTFQFGPNNRNPDSLNEHLAFRQAVAHAIDRQAVVAAIPGAGYAIDSYVEALLPELAQSNWPAFDPVAAQLLLDQLCSDLGRDCAAEPPVAVFSTTSSNEDRVLLAGLLQSMLGDVGIEVQLDLEDGQVFFGDTFDNASWDLGEWAWVGYNDLGRIVETHQWFDPDEQFTYNPYRWGTPDSSVVNANTARMAELVGLMAATGDEAELTAYLGEAEEILAEELVFVPLYVRDQLSQVEVEGPYRVVTADAGGNWVADFSVPWQDQSAHDIQVGTEGTAEEPDDDGDATYLDWNVDEPWNPSISIDKTAGTESVAGGDGITAAPGETVTWTYVVTNDGDIDVIDLIVSDDTVGEVCLAGGLVVGETLTCTHEEIAEPGWRSNIGTATATAVDADGNAQPVEATDDSSYFGLDRGYVGDGGGCVIDDFDLVFPPDMRNWPGHFKLSASNPGQFSWNAFIAADAGAIIGLEIPYPFVTQGALPLHAYDAVDVGDGACFTPIGEGTAFAATFALADYTDTNGDGSVGYGDVHVVSVSAASGFEYLTLHLDYGLKGTNGWTGGDGDAFNDPAVNPDLPGVNIADATDHWFGLFVDGAPVADGSDVATNHNEFKNVKGFGGLVLLAGDATPVTNAEVELRSADGVWIETMVTDAHGWYLSAYIHKGKTADYTLVLVDADGADVEAQVVTVGKNVKFGEANFFP